MKKFIAYIMSIVVGLTGVGCNSNSKDNKSEEIVKETSVVYEEEVDIQSIKVEEEVEEIPITLLTPAEPIEKTITISAVGDCTIGRDDRGSYTYSLPYYLEKNNYDYSYFFKNVYDILSEDDLTIANFEGTLTDATKRADKKFTFKGSSDYTKILSEGSVEAVNLANNHTKDYLDKGYEDTLTNLDNGNIPYFGNGIYEIQEVDGIKIGLAGIKGWDVTSAKKEIDNAKEYFDKESVNLIIYSFHWGVEREYKQNKTQEAIARYAIDNGGANLVLGHHPHVLQGIEKYNGVYIVYSLANFVFGGNKNPNDKNTMIVQVDYTFKDDCLIDSKINIIPASISSVSNTNNYQPTPLDEEKSELVLERILKSSTNFQYKE